VDRDQVLATVSLYWFTRPGATAARTLYEQARSADWGAPPAVPQGFAVFGADPASIRWWRPALEGPGSAGPSPAIRNGLRLRAGGHRCARHGDRPRTRRGEQLAAGSGERVAVGEPIGPLIARANAELCANAEL
jgi:hypothetical protein